MSQQGNLSHQTCSKFTLTNVTQNPCPVDRRRLSAISEHEKSELLFASINPRPSVQYSYTSKNERVTDVVHIHKFIDIKGWKALGNRLVDRKAKIGDVIKKEEIKTG